MTSAPKDRKPFIMGIAGGSGSGKTTFSRRVVEECRKIGITSQIFSLDNYYRPLSHLSLAERKAYNFDHPDAIDFELAHKHLRTLCAGSPVELPVYDFKSYTRKDETVTCEPAQLLVVEGLYALYPKNFLSLYHYRIFVSTGIATAVLRRIERDVAERGREVGSAKHQILTSVLPMYEAYVRPTQKNAHFSIDWDGEEVPEKATEGLVRMVRDFFR